MYFDMLCSPCNLYPFCLCFFHHSYDITSFRVKRFGYSTENSEQQQPSIYSANSDTRTFFKKRTENTPLSRTESQVHVEHPNLYITLLSFCFSNKLFVSFPQYLCGDACMVLFKASRTEWALEWLSVCVFVCVCFDVSMKTILIVQNVIKYIPFQMV